jgi:hypothetical protein
MFIAADKLNLADRFQLQRTNQAKMLTHELSLVEEFSIARRDAAIRALLEPRLEDQFKKEALSSKAKRLIKERLVNLAGSKDFETTRKVQQVRRKIKSKIDTELRTATVSLADVLKVQGPTFDTDSTETYELSEDKREAIIKEAIRNNPQDKEEDVRVSANELLGMFVKACNEVVAFNKDFPILVKNFDAIDKAEKQLNNAKTEKTLLKEELDTLKKEYNKAVAAVKEAQEALAKDNSKEAEEALREKVKAVREALSKLPEVAGALGQKDAAEKQIESIDTVLRAAAGSSAPGDADPSTAQAIVAQLPSFYGRVVEIAAIRKAPSLNALVLEKSRLQALRTDAEKQIRRTTTKIDLLEANRDALLAESKLLLDANQHLGWAKDANNGSEVTFENLKDPKVSEDVRRHTIMGIALYLGTFTGPRRAVHETEYRLIDLKHQASVDRSETALVLWQTAIAQSTKSLSAYYAGGLKSEHFIERLKALGLGAIAVGVN